MTSAEVPAAEGPVVLDSGAAARTIASACGCELVTSPPAGAGRRPCVVVIESDDDARAIAEQLGRAPRPFDVVVAWGLSEEAVLHLLEADLPVLCGVPDPTALREAAAGWSSDLGASARATAATLASAEAELLHAAAKR